MSLDMLAFFSCLFAFFLEPTAHCRVSEQVKQHPKVLFKTLANTTECHRIKARKMPTFSHLLYLFQLAVRPIKKRFMLHLFLMLLEREQALWNSEGQIYFPADFLFILISGISLSVYILFLSLFFLIQLHVIFKIFTGKNQTAY